MAIMEIDTATQKKIRKEVGDSFTDRYRRVGEIAGLKARRLDLYVAYMNSRWPKGQSTSYATEWADRFIRGTEVARSDLAGVRLLEKLNKEIL